MSFKKKLLIAAGLLTLVGIIAVFVIASAFAKRFEPYIREQAILYLQKRFDSDVELKALRVRMPGASPLKLALTRGAGAIARVEGEGLVLRRKGLADTPPMFAMRKFHFDVDLGTIFASPKIVPLISLEGLEINIPPKGERPRLTTASEPKEPPPGPARPADTPPVIIKEVLVNGAKLVILPKDPKKVPLDFDIYKLRLESVGPGMPMKYTASLRNAKPPGEIHSQGVFGPWNTAEPDATNLAGNYTFQKADLGVFSGIAGILDSTGQFEGTLGAIHARGEAVVPDFRLKMSGNPVPLKTRFEVLVDGTNGNTILKPVIATLGSTGFTTSGGVIKHEGDLRRAISLDVSMPNGDLRDVLRLAMKGQPFMEGKLMLKTKIDIPPLTGKVRDKLMLDGHFEVSDGKFLRSNIQDQIDSLSRRGQGQPKSVQIDEVVSWMAGTFKMQNEAIDFQSLAFGVPGANIALSGGYNLDGDVIDFRGALRLQAKVSETMTGWKRWALKPVDPFFAKRGSGTFLNIKIVGTSREPKFGLDRGANGDKDKEAASRQKDGPR